MKNKVLAMRQLSSHPEAWIWSLWTEQKQGVAGVTHILEVDLTSGCSPLLITQLQKKEMLLLLENSAVLIDPAQAVSSFFHFLCCLMFGFW